MQDPFNYLAFEVNIELGVKRIYKFSNGQSSVIQEVRDGGIPQNTWYKVYIRAIKNRFEVNFGDSSKYQEYKALPSVFKFEDSSVSKGK